MYLCMPSPGRPLARREFRFSGVSFFSGANTRPCKTKKKTNVSRSYVFAGAKSRARSSYFTAYCVVIQSAARSLFDDVLLIAVGQLWGAYTRARIQSKQEYTTNRELNAEGVGALWAQFLSGSHRRMYGEGERRRNTSV